MRESSRTPVAGRARLAMLVLVLAACQGSVPPRVERPPQGTELRAEAKVGEACEDACAKGAVCVAGICRERMAHEICAGARSASQLTDRLAKIDPGDLMALRAHKSWPQVAQILGMTLAELRPQLCHMVGLCTAGVDGTFAPGDAPCVADTDAHCRGSLLCGREGLCVVAGGRCIAGSEADCRASKVCVEHGRCKPGKLGPHIGENDALEVGPQVCTSEVIGGYSLPDDLASQVQLLKMLARGPTDVAVEAARYAVASEVSELREAVCRSAGAGSPVAVRVVLAGLADHPDPYTRQACALFAGVGP